MIILSSNAATNQVAALQKLYPDLKIIVNTEEGIILKGIINKTRSYNNYPIIINASLRIHIPINTDKFPSVFDEDETIDKHYPHRYSTGELCLATIFDLRMHFLNGFDLTQWMEDFVEPYYYSYKYYCDFGFFPFGDRAHGWEGAKQAYQEFFNITNSEILMNFLMNISSTSQYRGHHLCFCGSNKKTRNCHGDKIFLFYKYPSLRKQLGDDLKLYHMERNYEKYRSASK